MVKMAKISKRGATQSVQLPKEFRFKPNTHEVCIEQVGPAIMIYPKDKSWECMANAISQFDPDFMAERNQPRCVDPREPH